MTTNPPDDRPIIALAMGDPAGVGAELTARLLTSDNVRTAAHLIVVGDRRTLDEGARVAGLPLDFDQTEPETLASGRAVKPVFVNLANLDPTDVSLGVASLAGGRFATQNFAFALKLAESGRADAVCFMPFNKIAMRYAYPGYDDEIRFISDVIGFTGRAREFNVLEAVWNARVTSHMPLAEVSRNLSKERHSQRTGAHLRLPEARRRRCSKNRGGRIQSARRRRRQFRQGGDRDHRPGRRGSGETRMEVCSGTLSRRHRVPQRDQGRLSRGADDVS